MDKSALKDWEELSNWYDKKQGDVGDLWHRTLIDPTLLKVIGSCRGKQVLDLGCGNGYLSRTLAKGRAKVTAVDASLRMIRNAKARDPRGLLKIRYMRSSAGKLEGVSGSRFDLVIANMSLMDIENAEDAIKEVGRVLKRGGRFVASISHPCFDVMSHSGWVAVKMLASSLLSTGGSQGTGNRSPRRFRGTWGGAASRTPSHSTGHWAGMLESFVPTVWPLRRWRNPRRRWSSSKKSRRN